MRVTTASLTLSASVTLVLAGALGNSLPLRAEPMTIRFAEPAPDLSSATDQWPQEVAGLTFNSSHQEDPRKLAEDGKRPHEISFKGHQAPPVRGGQAEEISIRAQAQAIEASLASAMSGVANGDSSVEQEVKQALWSIHDELSDAGVVDALIEVKFHLGLNSDGSSTEPSALGYGGSREPVNWEIDRFTLPPSADEIEKQRLLASAMFKELLEAIKLLTFILVSLYVLGRLIKFSFDYVRWKSTRTLRRGARRRKRVRTASSRRQRGVTRRPPPA